MTEHQEHQAATGTMATSTVHPVNPVAFMRTGYAHCRMIVEEGRPVDFIHLEVNQGYERLTGLKNVTGLRMTEVLPGVAESNPEFIEKHRAVVESGISDQFEVFLQVLNKWYDISIYSPQKGESVALFEDITVRKQTEESLRQSEERFRSLFEGHSAIMMVIDPSSGNIMDANLAAANFYGWSLIDLCGMRIQDINTLPPDEVRKEMEKTRSLKQNYFPFRHRRANGSIRDVDVFSNVINLNGKELLYSIVHDVTDRKKYESIKAFRLRILHAAESASVKELLLAILDFDEDEKSIDTLFDAFPEPMFLLDQNGTILVANKSFIAGFNTGEATILGTNIDNHLSSQLAAEWKKKIKEALCSGERLAFEDERRERRYRHTIYPIPNKEGNITKLLISNTDITSLNLTGNEQLDHRIHYRNLFNNMLNGFAYCRMVYDGDHPADFVFEVVNLNFKKLFGIQNLEGRKFFEVTLDSAKSDLTFVERLGRIADTGVSERFEFNFKKLNRRFDITSYSQQKGYFVLVLKPVKMMNTCNWEWNLESGEMIWSDDAWMFYDQHWYLESPSFDGWLNSIATIDRESTLQTTQKALAEGGKFNVVYHAIDAEGAVRQLRSQGLPVKGDDGVVKRYMGITTDITEWSSEDNNNLINNDNLTNLLNSGMEPLCSLTIDGKILEENSDFRDIYAINAQSLKGHDFHQLFPEELAEERKKKFEHVFATGEPVHFKDKYQNSDGAEFIYQISAYPIYEETKKIESLAVFITKQNEYNEAEKARRQLDKQYQTLIAASPDSIITTHLNGVISSISDIGLEIFGASKKSDLTGLPFSTIVYPGNQEVIEEIFDVTLREGLVQNREILLKKKNNTVYSAEISAALIQDYNGAPLSFMIIIRDISQRKIIENELFHAKKLISLGEMASGIAHEIYQPINNIGLMVDKMLMTASKNDWSCKEEIKTTSEKIFENIIRAQTIIDNIRSFSSTDNNYISSDVNINKSIRNSLLMVSEQCKHRSITLDFKSEQERFPVTGNIYKFEQVMFNLIKNSMDALEEKKQLNIQPFEMKILIRSFYVNSSVVVTVEDNGIGISEKNLEYIMHPFYTTKESGKGTGLGLSISYGIIKEMNGEIRIKSTPMSRTSVIITLPKTVK